MHIMPLLDDFLGTPLTILPIAFIAIWTYHEIRRGDASERRQVSRALLLYVFPVMIEIAGRLFADSKSSFGVFLVYAIALFQLVMAVWLVLKSNDCRALTVAQGIVSLTISFYGSLWALMLIAGDFI
jgi:hypothetical protein